MITKRNDGYGGHRVESAFETGLMVGRAIVLPAVMAGLVLLLTASLTSCAASEETPAANQAEESVLPESSQTVSTESEDSAQGSIESVGSTVSDSHSDDSAADIPDWLRREIDSGYTLADAKDANCNLWIKRGEKYFGLEILPVSEGPDYEGEADGCYYGFYPVKPYRALNGTGFTTKIEEVVRNVEYAPVLNLAEGDQLVITSPNDIVEVMSVIGEVGYVYDDGRTIYTGEGVVSNYREIDGVEVEDDESRSAALASKGIVYNEQVRDYVAPSVTSATGGFFSGTDWETETLRFDQQVLHVKETPKQELPVQETKEGYFIVDTSALEPGAYIVGQYYFEVA